MAAGEELELKLLAGDDLDMAYALADSIGSLDDPRSEAWGVPVAASVKARAKAWGLFLRGTMSGAVWIIGNPDGVGEAAALALPRGRWGMGLSTWMLTEVMKTLGKHNCSALKINIAKGGPVLGEALSEAGFKGPDLAAAGYPAGEWTSRVKKQG